MARIAGVDLPRDKAIGIALTYIYGVGRTSATKICEAAEIPVTAKTFDLDETEVSKLRAASDEAVAAAQAGLGPLNYLHK